MTKMFSFHMLVGLYAVTYSGTTYGCTLPASFAGTWKASEHGTITMNRTHIFNFPTVSSTTGVPVDSEGRRKTFDYVCVENNGSLYTFRSTDTILVFGTNLYVLMCLDIRNVLDTKMVYYKASKPDPLGRYFHVATEAQLVDKTISVLCNNADYEQSYNSNIMIKSGRESSASILCPEDLFGTYTYNTCNDTTSSNTSMNVCETRKQLVFDYTLCSTSQLFSGEGSLDCVFYVTRGSVTYLTLYNRDSTEPDGSTYYQYVCLAVEKLGDTVFVTARPRLFLNEQNSTYIDSTGVALQLNHISLCPLTTRRATSTAYVPADATTGTTVTPLGTRADLALILGVVFGALIVTIAAVVFAVVCIKKKNRTMNTTAGIETEWSKW